MYSCMYIGAYDRGYDLMETCCWNKLHRFLFSYRQDCWRVYLQAGGQFGRWQSTIMQSFSQTAWSCYNYLPITGNRCVLGLFVAVVGKHRCANVGSAVHSQCCRLILHLHMSSQSRRVISRCTNIGRHRIYFWLLGITQTATARSVPAHKARW